MQWLGAAKLLLVSLSPACRSCFSQVTRTWKKIWTHWTRHIQGNKATSWIRQQDQLEYHRKRFITIHQYQGLSKQKSEVSHVFVTTWHIVYVLKYVTQAHITQEFNTAVNISGRLPMSLMSVAIKSTFVGSLLLLCGGVGVRSRWWISPCWDITEMTAGGRVCPRR